MDRPSPIEDKDLRHDSFSRSDHRTKRLPAMGWNSWNAFGSGNTEELTRTMVGKILELGLDKLGYEYIVLDDGCYMPVRIEGRLAADDVKFPSGFGKLSDFIHANGLKFGMYNDIGTKLCSGIEVGICGHEKEDCEDYVKWGIDFIKVDNCYYPWDNATFADTENARFTFAPNIKSIEIDGITHEAKDAIITGTRAEVKDGYVTFIGTYDGTAPDRTPVGLQSSELIWEILSDKDKTSEFNVTYATGREEGIGEWLQAAVNDEVFFDGLLPATESPEEFVISDTISIRLHKGTNRIRLMNHRRQENTLQSYTRIRQELDKAGGSNITMSICEWGKTQPQDWGHKVGDSWRILNDIKFQVGSDGTPGKASWNDDYTLSITSQYNKAVIMDEFSGLTKGWNDPDMMVIGMNGIDDTMSRSHMAMWCMLNAPLMLGLDLRKVSKGDAVHNIISDEDLIALNQDPLGIQAKRIFTTIECEEPDKEYIRDIRRIDVLAKPLANGDLALAFFNLDKETRADDPKISIELILDKIGSKMVNRDLFANASGFDIRDLYTKETVRTTDRIFSAGPLGPCDSKIIRITPAS
ncbi:MAG: glycoside hydrolase family 27 protein [Clostridiales bacterium]|nr:glycoside hydrolase family 27 protein [Clostridiales bacterium]